ARRRGRARRPQGAAHQAAARAADAAGLRRRARGAAHRQGAAAHPRWAAHVALSHVLHLGQGRARARLSQPPLSRRRRRCAGLVPHRRLSDRTWLTGIGLLSLGVWLYMLLARGGFWRARERDDDVVAPPARWPSVVAVVPARNEADVIAR